MELIGTVAKEVPPMGEVVANGVADVSLGAANPTVVETICAVYHLTLDVDGEEVRPRVQQVASEPSDDRTAALWP
eukprot:13779180-Alexandrium_andersonii.AAC.1